MSDRCEGCDQVPNPDGFCACPIINDYSAMEKIRQQRGLPDMLPVHHVESLQQRESDLDYFYRRHAELTKRAPQAADLVALILARHVTRIVEALKAKYEIGTSSQFMDDPPDWDSATDEELKKLIIDTLLNDTAKKTP